MDAELNAAGGLLLNFASAEANKRTGIAIPKYGNIIINVVFDYTISYYGLIMSICI